MTRDAIIDSFLAHFAGRYETTQGAVREAELEAAQALVAEKFGTEAWINLVP
jgi:lipoate-protein ligase A